MNSVYIFILLFLGVNLLGAQTPIKTKDKMLEKTSSCTSLSTEIINSQEQNFVELYLRKDFRNDFIGTFGTIVHECLHAYDSDLSDTVSWDNDTYPIAYFVDRDNIIRFAGRRLFKTEKLHASYFPKDVKNLFRYGTYIYNNQGPSDVTANQWGFYGLLEEFNAYYHDLKSQIEYFTCSNYEGPVDVTFGNAMHAYFEFNIFMAYYLMYAEENEKSDYQYMMDNLDLRLAYTLIEIKWRNLLTEIMSSKNLSSRMASYNEEIRLFNSELKTKLESFMVVLNDNYSQFSEAYPFDMSVVEDHKDWAHQLNLTGFGAGMSAEELSEAYEDMDEFEINFEEKDLEYFYVIIKTTKSEEELMNIILANYPIYKKSIGVVMDSYLNFAVYLEKFKSKEKAKKKAQELEDEFPGINVW